MPCRTCRQYLASSDDEDRLQPVKSRFQATRDDSLALRNQAIELRQQSRAIRAGRDGPPRPPDPLYRMLQLVCAVTVSGDSAPYWALFRDVIGL